MRRVCQMRPDVPTVLASTAETPELACPDGVVAHSLPRPPRDRRGRPYEKWVARLRKSLATIAREQNAATLICDGAAPWPDLLPGIDRAGVSHAARVLSARECLSDVPPDHTEWDVFNQIIVLDDGAAQTPLDERLPRELIESKVERVEPIIYADPDELEERAAVRRRWNVRPDQRLAYVQPPDRGAASWLQRVFHALEAHDDVRAIVSDNASGRQHTWPPRVLASLSTADARRCWRGLDLAIVTPLYTITHELLHFGIPTVLVADAVDANARARAVSFQRALAAVTVTEAAFLADAIALALSDDVRATLVRRSRERLPTNGAAAAARLIVAASAPTVPSTTP